MKKIQIAIFISTLFLLIFQLSSYMGISMGMIFMMYVFAPLIVITLVTIVLKYGESSSNTFEDRFYDDYEA